MRSRRCSKCLRRRAIKHFAKNGYGGLRGDCNYCRREEWRRQHATEGFLDVNDRAWIRHLTEVEMGIRRRLARSVRRLSPAEVRAYEAELRAAGRL